MSSSLRPAPVVGALRWCIVASLALLGASEADAAVVPAEIVVSAGDTPMGASEPVATIHVPFALDNGSVAFDGQMLSGDTYVFVDDQIVWLGSDETTLTLSSAEQTMGANTSGGFVYAPSADGLDSIWTQNGLLSLASDQAPLYPVGAPLTFVERPSMLADGTVYWLAGINTSGSGATEHRALYRSASATPGDEVIVLATGDTVGSLTIDEPSGIDTDYAVSADGTHLIAVLLMDTGSTVNDGHIYLDGSLVAQEDTANGSGDNWDNFDVVAVNNAGSYVFSGDTNGATGTDEFIAVNGSIAVREGDTIDGVTLTTTATVRFVAIAESGRVAYGWAHSSNALESVFYACDPGDIAGSSMAVLTTSADQLDLDGDGTADATVTDLAMSQNTGSEVLTDDDALYLPLALDDGSGAVATMVRIPVSCCGNSSVDFDEQCDDGNDDDTDDCTTACEDAACGDGFVHAGVEECDDANADDTDDCLATCVSATCGDGFVHAGVEECDDGNTMDDDACASDCTLPAVGSDSGDSGDSSGGDTSGGDTSDGDTSDGDTSDGDTSGGDTSANTDDGDTGSLDDTGTDTGMSGGNSTSGPATTATTADAQTDSGSSDDSGSSAGASDDGGGCSCRTRAAPSSLAWLLVVLPALRRRRRAGPTTVR